MACFSQLYVFLVCLLQPAWLGLMKRTKMWLRNERLIGDICDFKVLLCLLWAVSSFLGSLSSLLLCVEPQILQLLHFSQAPVFLSRIIRVSRRMMYSKILPQIQICERAKALKVARLCHKKGDVLLLITFPFCC